MPITFKKYFSEGKDYLIFDSIKNDYEMNDKRAKLIANRHIGVGATAILMGPVFHEDGIHMEILGKKEGEEITMQSAVSVFARYLKDNDYVQKKQVILYTTEGAVKIVYLNENATELKISTDENVSFSDECLEESSSWVKSEVGYVGTITLGYEFLGHLRQEE